MPVSCGKSCFTCSGGPSLPHALKSRDANNGATSAFMRVSERRKNQRAVQHGAALAGARVDDSRAAECEGPRARAVGRRNAYAARAAGTCESALALVGHALDALAVADRDENRFAVEIREAIRARAIVADFEAGAAFRAERCGGAVAGNDADALPFARHNLFFRKRLQSAVNRRSVRTALQGDVTERDRANALHVVGADREALAARLAALEIVETRGKHHRAGRIDPQRLPQLAGRRDSIAPHAAVLLDVERTDASLTRRALRRNRELWVW